MARASDRAKELGTTMVKIERFSEYNQDTLRRMHKNKPDRFKAFCLATLCDDIGLTADQMKAAKTLMG